MIIWLFVVFAVIALPVIYIYFIKPKKSLKEGLKDWIEESANDI